MRLIFLTLFLATQLFGHHGGEIELLYLKPTIDQSFFTIDGDNFSNGQHFPNGKRFNCDPDFRPGFRLEGWHDCGCIHFFDWRFTYFNASHLDSQSGALHDTVGAASSGAQTPEDTVYFGIAKLDQRFNYYGLDVWRDNDAVWNVNFFISTILIVLTIIIFSIWIMHDLNTNMLP